MSKGVQQLETHITTVNDTKEKAEADSRQTQTPTPTCEASVTLWPHLLPCSGRQDRPQCMRDAYHHLLYVDFLKLLVARSILVLKLFKEPLHLSSEKSSTTLSLEDRYISFRLFSLTKT